jgi:hypothetical protein
MQVGERVVQGLLISPEDRAYLLSLDNSQITVGLACPGRRTAYARIESLIRRMVPVPYSDDWYVSVTATGPLYGANK